MNNQSIYNTKIVISIECFHVAIEEIIVDIQRDLFWKIDFFVSDNFNKSKNE